MWEVLKKGNIQKEKRYHHRKKKSPRTSHDDELDNERYETTDRIVLYEEGRNARGKTSPKRSTTEKKEGT